MDQTDKTVDFESLLTDVRQTLASPEASNTKLTELCGLLRKRVPHYDWVGFYLVDLERERELILGPYSGDPTDHTRIEFGQGICGQAADREETFVVQDVSKEDNYLSCSVDVKSEIVVPIFRASSIVGEIDIDSHTIAPFTDADRHFLNQVAYLVAPTL
jgi:L-methionine (R)-S-oxide reductase